MGPSRAVIAVSAVAVGVWVLCLAQAAGGQKGPTFEAGVSPLKLGWGTDDQAYPQRSITNPTDGAEMVWVPPGTFRMGSTQAESDQAWQENGWEPDWKVFAEDEQPAHEVMLTRGFWLYRHEVTNEQYAQFLAATGREPPPHWDDYKAQPRFPVNWVTWADAVAYATWVEGALPTEAEWEYAARGPERRLFPWGNWWDKSEQSGLGAWDPKHGDSMLRSSNVAMHLRDVGSFPAGTSWCGALDMAGSLWEWCADWYDRGYYAKSPPQDPPGPETGDDRVLRGGSWFSFPSYCRGACRFSFVTHTPDARYGFRLVRVP